MCNDRSSFSTFKNLSLPIVNKLGDDSSVTATHYGFVNVIQGYQVEALRTLTFRLSLLSINQWDVGGHTTLFRDRKCSITSPSSCTLARKLVNGIYIIVPATALLSSTTKSGKKRKRQLTSKSNHQRTYNRVFRDGTYKSTYFLRSKVKTMAPTTSSFESYCHKVYSEGIYTR